MSNATPVPIDSTKIVPFVTLPAPQAVPAAAKPVEPASPSSVVPLSSSPGPRPLPKCAIGYIHRPEVSAGFSLSMIQLVAGDMAMENPVFDGRILDHGAPPYLNLARNALVAQFLTEFPAEIEGLLMVDADNKWRPEQAYQLVGLLDHDLRPVVSGLYFAWDAEKYMPRPVLNVNGKTMWNYPGGALVGSKPEEDKISCGMGFTIISRQWLEAWKETHGATWFDFRGTGKAGAGGFAIEDRAFFERVWSTGHRVHVHTGIKIGHEKTVDVNEKLYAALRLLNQSAIKAGN